MKKPARIRAPRAARGKVPMILKEVRTAANNKVALLGGILLGGYIPFSVYWLMHQEAQTSTPLFEVGGQPIVFAHCLVLGGLAYSAKTVYQWGRAVFADRFKAVGFTLLVEGILTFGHSACLIFPALGILVLINGIAATSRLAETDIRFTTPPLQPRRMRVPVRDRVEVQPEPRLAVSPLALPGEEAQALTR